MTCWINFLSSFESGLDVSIGLAYWVVAPYVGVVC